MRGRAGPAALELSALVRGASFHAGPWPAISIWHGSADQTVVPANGEAILRQWLGVHGLEERPTFTEVVAGYPRRVLVRQQRSRTDRDVQHHWEWGMARRSRRAATLVTGNSGAYNAWTSAFHPRSL
jgi:poly(3-hydroxybutyrate) depolymerase